MLLVPTDITLPLVKFAEILTLRLSCKPNRILVGVILALVSRKHSIDLVDGRAVTASLTRRKAVCILLQGLANIGKLILIESTSW